MIPVFPEFRPLVLADRAAVDAVVHSFPPYSDFSFSNLYAWDAEVSSLYGNLVVRLTDYINGSPVLSFIGQHRLEETAAQLLEFARTKYRSAVLRMVPACVAQALAEAGYSLEADDTATDYVFSVDHIASMHVWTGHSARRRIRQFAAQHRDYSIRHAPLNAIDADEFRALFTLWAVSKGYSPPLDSDEFLAFERFLCSADPHVETVGLYVGARLVGFSTYELPPSDTALVHFSKCDHAFHSGVCNVLFWEEAKLLQARGVIHYNWGSDLGLQNLRQSKRKYKPSHFLKTFTVRSARSAHGDEKYGR